MDPVFITIIAVAAVAVLAVVFARARLRARHNTLRSRFGDEYDRVVARSGRHRGEQELLARLRET